MNNWQRFCLVFAGLSGAIAVTMGAAAAHWLQATLDSAAILRIEKAATYQFYHSLALLVLPLLMQHWPNKKFRIASGLIMLGILCFCGSLYAYSFTGLHFLVWITPLGGLSWIAGWICIALAGFCCIAQKTAGQ